MSFRRKSRGGVSICGTRGMTQRSTRRSSNMELSLKQRISNWLQARPQEVWAKGELERLIMGRTTYTADNIGRRLRELEVEGKLLVTYKKGHAHYQWNPNQVDFTKEEALFNSL